MCVSDVCVCSKSDVCVCVCVCEREREIGRERDTGRKEGGESEIKNGKESNISLSLALPSY